MPFSRVEGWSRRMARRIHLPDTAASVLRVLATPLTGVVDAGGNAALHRPICNLRPADLVVAAVVSAERLLFAHVRSSDLRSVISRACDLEDRIVAAPELARQRTRRPASCQLLRI